MAVSTPLQEAFNRHINAEFYSSYLYLSMSTYCDSIDLPGFAHWMRIQSQEEYDWKTGMGGLRCCPSSSRPSSSLPSKT